ncbi:DUF1643 domain-containing protein [Pseudomonas brenneri]
MFKFFGSFYAHPMTPEKFRRSLSIVREGMEVQRLDALVIMMNPGGSTPLCDHIPKCSASCLDEASDLPVPTDPDKTQHRITALMKLKNWNHVRVINLSDVRAQKLHLVKVVDLPDDHSMFAPSRAAELDSELSKAPLVICAWGKSSELAHIARLAMVRLDSLDIPIYGIANAAKTDYYHPLYPGIGYWPNEMAKLIP